tara:strand:+ start:49 stop:681 length:633 start_codon:yes stop_codon:yes gene_type:complete
MSFTRKEQTKKHIKRCLVLGIGVNDSYYAVDMVVDGERFICPYYRKWVDMLRRCYASKRSPRHTTYVDCFVCEDWLIFSNFRIWMEGQDWENKQLDKDIKFSGNKEYSPLKCLFVDQSLNKLFLKNENRKTNNLPTGVTLDKRTNTYQVKLRRSGVIKYIGSSKNITIAERMYIEAKNDYIRECAEANPEIGKYLLNNLLKLPSSNSKLT